MFWEFKLCFPPSNYVRKASELCFEEKSLGFLRLKENATLLLFQWPMLVLLESRHERRTRNLIV